MSGLNARLEGFAREQLALGRGEWWIVHELARIGHVDPVEAHAIVARAWPTVFKGFNRRRRAFLIFGIVLLVGWAIPWVSLPFMTYGFGHHDAVAMFMFMSPALAIGLALVMHGWRGYRRSKDSAISLPGSDVPGPVRTGLAWRAHPFEWK